MFNIGDEVVIASNDDGEDPPYHFTTKGSIGVIERVHYNNQDEDATDRQTEYLVKFSYLESGLGDNDDNMHWIYEEWLEHNRDTVRANQPKYYKLIKKIKYLQEKRND